MKLEVVIPTYNRSHLLGKTISSLFNVEPPAGMTVKIIVVDNNSTDNTRELVHSAMAKFGGRLMYLFEKRQGRSYALNRGIESTGGELIGFVDDDEEIDVSWYQTIYSTFTNNNVDFIGGPYVPRFESEIPDWLPQNYTSVVGIVNGGDKLVPFDSDYPGILMGGNAVLRRDVLLKVGLYSTSLGRSGKRLLSCEDEQMYQRLLAAGARGLYVPALRVFHFIPRERLTKRYHRSWCFWQSVSSAVLDRERAQPVAYTLGVPRYLYGRALRGLISLVRGKDEDPASRFSSELSLWDLAGFFYGKHFYRSGASEG